MSEQRPRVLQGWGEVDPARSGWRRNRDWIGQHTILAALAGGGIAALIGYAVISFVPSLSATPQGDIAEVQQAAMEEAIAEAMPAAYAAAFEQVRIEELIELVVHQRQGGESDWAVGFREGWAAGWNKAVDAMRQISLEMDLPPTAPEFQILDRVEMR